MGRFLPDFERDYDLTSRPVGPWAVAGRDFRKRAHALEMRSGLTVKKYEETEAIPEGGTQVPVMARVSNAF